MAAGVCVCKCGHLHWSGAVWCCVVVVVVWWWWWACECKRETAALGKSGLVLCGALSVGIGIGIGTLGAGLAPPPVNFFSGTHHTVQDERCRYQDT